MSSTSGPSSFLNEAMNSTEKTSNFKTKFKLRINLKLWMVSNILDVRLQDGGGVTHHQGRVEVYYNGAWGTVCDNGWDLADAWVVCRQLGFERALKATKLAAFGEGTGKIWMSNVRCTGSESSLKECSHNGWGRHFHCGHGKDAGVMCSYAGSFYIIVLPIRP